MIELFQFSVVRRILWIPNVLLPHSKKEAETAYGIIISMSEDVRRCPSSAVGSGAVSSVEWSRTMHNVLEFEETFSSSCLPHVSRIETYSSRRNMVQAGYCMHPKV